ncbi:hypothetical protein [Membranihabitans maritimus]|uniref:hypothetical protein n=1 Tax=Membranihabitans maritimus TaxID=2904244 RepID=UPI001F196413|nr:hypothetical protein [Membranihabitans maritimus]
MHYRIVLFITLSLTICTHLYTQSDSAEWAPIGTTWYYNFNSSNVYPQANALKMESIKDTMVNEKPARIIEGTIYYHSGDTLHAPDVFPEGRIILHQQGDSIYYLRENTFELLYDFSLEEGDTMNIVTPEPYRPNIENDTMIQVVIDSTGERVLDGDTLRTQIVSTNYSRFYTSYQMYGEIIEKIGNQEFLLPNYNGVCDAYCPFSLRCYQDSTIF